MTAPASGLRCAMVVGWSLNAAGDGPGGVIVCGKPASRYSGPGREDEGCCADCFVEMLDGGFTEEELERDYPVVQ